MTAIQADVPLTIAECYTGVWQGEGPSTGRLCSFVRLGGCNLTCGWKRGKDGLTRLDGAWACDEAFTWHSGFGLHATLARVPAGEVLGQLDKAADPLVVITGGEPLLHQDTPGYAELTYQLLAAGREIEIETNGTLVPRLTHRRVRYNVSPKLACSGLEPADRLISPALDWHAAYHGSVFKFVVTTPADVGEAAAIAAAHGIPPDRMWIMPEGTTSARVLDVARQVAPAVAAHRYNLTLRQQTLLYEEAREPRGE
jgi:7-carboxy-7-deazaguanine synthase